MLFIVAFMLSSNVGVAIAKKKFTFVDTYYDSTRDYS